MTQNRIRFADGALDDVASVLVSASDRAGQYLEQCPALAVLAFNKFGSHITYGEMDRFKSLVSQEPRLRDVLSAYSAPAPIRKIQPSALRMRHSPTLRALSSLAPSTLSQCIPTDSQGVWLDGVGKWLRLMPNGKRAQAKFSVEWIARRLGEDLSRFEQVEAVIDWIGRGEGVLNEKWSWERALAEVEAWHMSLRDEASLRALAAAEKERATFDTVICKAPVPDVADVAGYSFVALRTLRALREEGQVMHHCVASYANDVRKGRCSIASVRRDGVNIATLEINAKGVVTQIKAHCNRSVDQAVRDACEEYAFTAWKTEVAS